MPMEVKTDMTEKLTVVAGFYEALSTPVYYCRERKIVWSNSAAGELPTDLWGIICCPPQKVEELHEVARCGQNYQLRFRRFEDGYFVEVLETKPLLLTEFLSSVTSLTDMVSFLSRTSSSHIFHALPPVRMILERTEQYQGCRYLDVISASNYQLFRFASLLQEYQNLENLKQPVYQNVNFVREIEFLFSSVRLHMLRRNVPFFYNLPKTPVVGHGDIHRLNIALLQLISNAFYFTAPNNEVRASMKVKENQMVFEVRDKGVGISAGLIEKVFCPFFSYDPNTGDAAGGGLGLSYVALFAKKYGGDCAITSFGGGTCVRLRCPLTKGNSSSERFQSPEFCSNQFDYSSSELSPVSVYLSNLLQMED